MCFIPAQTSDEQKGRKRNKSEFLLCWSVRTKEESMLIEQGRVLLLSKRKSRLKDINVRF